MRTDVYIAEVLAKCDVLRKSNLWLPESRLKPRLWLQNFELPDRSMAAYLLDHFTFYSSRMTDELLIASFAALGDGRKKGPANHKREELLAALDNAVFTPVLGETPDPTDSGNFLCRKTRQLLFPQAKTVVFESALDHAYQGHPVVFVDDFIGSGDQFITTWTRLSAGRSFELACGVTQFPSIYVALVSTKFGLSNIHKRVPQVAVSVTHVLEDRSTLTGINISSPGTSSGIESFLSKYAQRLTPREDYMIRNAEYIKYGYKNRKLLLAFEHSIPDATLPIFWSPGTNGWEPLIERT